MSEPAVAAAGCRRAWRFSALGGRRAGGGPPPRAPGPRWDRPSRAFQAYDSGLSEVRCLSCSWRGRPAETVSAPAVLNVDAGSCGGNGGHTSWNLVIGHSFRPK